MYLKQTLRKRILASLTLLLLVTLLAGACSAAPVGPAPTVESAAPAETAAVPEATATTTDDAAESQQTPQVQTTEAISAEVSASGTRQVTHDFGVAEVPVNPQRIVAINSAAIEYMAAMGIKPVGIAAWTGAGNQPRIPAHISAVMDLEGVEFLGDAYQPNLEAIAAVEPDLILMNSGSYYQEVYDQVSQIAPTVAFASWPDDSNKATWEEFFSEMATALDMEAEAQEVIDAWDTRVDNLRATVDVDDTELSVVRIMPETLMTYMKGSYSGTVLEAVGVKQVPSQEEVIFAKDVSMEQIPDLDGDAIMLIQSDPEAIIYEQLLASPLWQQLGAVQAGRVYLVDSDLWIGGDGYVSANAILDDLEKLFLHDGEGLVTSE